MSLQIEFCRRWQVQRAEEGEMTAIDHCVLCGLKYPEGCFFGQAPLTKDSAPLPSAEERAAAMIVPLPLGFALAPADPKETQSGLVQPQVAATLAGHGVIFRQTATGIEWHVFGDDAAIDIDGLADAMKDARIILRARAVNHTPEQSPNDVVGSILYTVSRDGTLKVSYHGDIGKIDAEWLGKTMKNTLSLVKA